MSATLREYLFGKLRTRLWHRYDKAMQTIAEFGEKFEKDEQAGANVAFRHRYRKGIELVRAVVNEPTELRGAELDGPIEYGVVEDLEALRRMHPLRAVPPVPANEATHAGMTPDDAPVQFVRDVKALVAAALEAEAMMRSRGALTGFPETCANLRAALEHFGEL
jgi:hypothetical protein